MAKGVTIKYHEQILGKGSAAKKIAKRGPTENNPLNWVYS
jgi:hypothetical protein